MSSDTLFSTEDVQTQDTVSPQGPERPDFFGARVGGGAVGSAPTTALPVRHHWYVGAPGPGERRCAALKILPTDLQCASISLRAPMVPAAPGERW